MKNVKVLTKRTMLGVILAGITPIFEKRNYNKHSLVMLSSFHKTNAPKEFNLHIQYFLQYI